MLTLETIQQMAAAFPMQDDSFDLEGAYKWFRGRYQKINWEQLCQIFIEFIKQRAVQEGYAPIPGKNGLYQKIQVRLTAETIQRRVAQLGKEIGQDYQHQQLVLVGVLNACLPFVGKLLAALPQKAQALTQYRLCPGV